MRRREWKEKERLRIEWENGREWGDVKRLIGWGENERVERRGWVGRKGGEGGSRGDYG